MVNRRRIGLMVTASNTTFESDFATVLPKGITYHSHRLWTVPGGKVESEEYMDQINSGVEEAARFLARAKVEVIAYGMTIGSFYRGVEYARNLASRIQAASGIPAITRRELSLMPCTILRPKRYLLLRLIPNGRIHNLQNIFLMPDSTS